jgi:dimeric dUTPase (all-alpha-NTP-PPase superfamily)
MKLENYKKMVELQHTLNIQTVGEDYLEKNLSWNSCIIAESGEMLGSLGYEWWKKQEVDLDNAKVEAIDLLHFVISEDLEDYKKDALCDTRFFTDWLADDFYTLFEHNNGRLLFRDMDIFKVIDELNFNQISRLSTLKAIFTKLEMSNEDVYIAYIVKNCLNKFRQDNGYKDGTYNKIWIDKEDNVVAYELAENIGASEDLLDLLYADLEASYSYYFKS